MSEKQFIDYRDLPGTIGGFPGIFCDYVKDFERVGQFYGGDFHSLDNIFAKVPEVRERYHNRARIVEILSDQNRRFGSGPRSMENIRKLGEDTTFAVVTGQQVGILGGPLYTIYKTITALKLAEELNSRFAGFSFIPVFWLEGEDHDFDEVNSITVLNQENAPVRTEYLIRGKPQEKNVGAVGEIIFDDLLTKFLQSAEESLSSSEFRKSVFDLIREYYVPGVSFNDAFARLMNRLFEDSGLVFVSAHDNRLKQLLTPVFQKEIQDYKTISQIMIERSAELEVSYHAQIKANALNLFFFHKGGRYHIEPREDGFGLKGVRQVFSNDELLRITSESPELISPNVALRPLCQDTILPTVAYVGGPSEIAYFAQLQPLYKYFGVTMPIIYPRASATIIEAKVSRILEKYELNLTDVFEGYEHVSKHVIATISEVNIEELFSEASARIRDLMGEMKFGLNYIDPTLQGPLDSTSEKMESLITVLKAKVTAAQQTKHETALRQLQKLNSIIYPNNNFQERELPILYFMNKYGTGFVKWLMGEVKPDAFQHQLLWLA